MTINHLQYKEVENMVSTHKFTVGFEKSDLKMKEKIIM